MSPIGQSEERLEDLHHLFVIKNLPSRVQVSTQSVGRPKQILAWVKCNSKMGNAVHDHVTLAPNPCMVCRILVGYSQAIHRHRKIVIRVHTPESWIRSTYQGPSRRRLLSNAKLAIHHSTNSPRNSANR